MTKDSSTLGVLFSFHRIGNSTKITAIDEASLCEVSVIAPSTLPQTDMERLALRKLQRMIQQSSHVPLS
jgi:hypothetical protein